MPVHVRRHLDRGVAEPGLHHLQRQFEPAVGTAIDAPRGVEVAQAMQAGILRAPVLIDDTGGNLRRMEATLDDGVAVINAALAVGKGEAEFAVGARELVLAQRGDHHRRQRHRALARLRLRPPDRAVPIGALANVKLAAF